MPACLETVNAVSDKHTTPVDETETTLDDTAEQPAVDGATESTPIDSELARLEDELADSRSKAQEYFDGWQRERADFVNFRKRMDRDLRDIRQNAAVDTLMALLPILDDFERAGANLPDELRDQPWLEGVFAIQRKLQKTLEDQGITAIDPVGEAFDPNLHEAIGMDASTDIPSGHVTVTLQKGYVIGDRVLRPALVRVAN